MEPPSAELLARLERFRLCTASDLKRCRNRVRKLTRDLPAFDSVWIDALVCIQKLTPFQAGILESDRPDSLQVGPCVLVAEQGRGVFSRTFRARHIDSGQPCILKRIHLIGESLTEAADGFQQLINRTTLLAHPHILTPRTLQREDNQLVLVSDTVTGPTLEELLIRRGRFPVVVVRRIAEQLMQGLAALHRLGLVHGEVQLHNVRLTRGGEAVLVDAGVQPALSPRLTVRDSFPPERYEGTAPELIGSRESATPASDLYALGCLLWQLLAGRPPFATGDPLNKLAAHRTQPIPAVSEFAPDTPADLAGLISELTSFQPDRRLQAFQEIIETTISLGWPARRVLRQFQSGFNSAVPLPRSGRGWVKWAAAATLLLTVGGVAGGWSHPTTRDQLLSLVAQARPVAEPDTETAAPGEPEPAGEPVRTAEAPAVETALQGRTIPEPDAAGVIELQSGDPYTARDIQRSGRLIVRGTGDRPAVVLVSRRALSLTAEAVLLENVKLQFEPVDEMRATSLLLAQCQQLVIRRTSFQRYTRQEHSHPVIGIGWKLQDARDRSGGLLQLQDTHFTGPGTGLFLADTPQRLQLQNVLKLGTGVLVALRHPPAAGRDFQYSLQQCTLRASGSLLKVALPDTPGPGGRILVEVNESVCELQELETALLELIGPQLTPAFLDQFQVIGEGSVINPSLTVAGWKLSARAPLRPLGETDVAVEGLLASPFEFAGPLSLDPRDSLLKSCQAPRRTSQLPGIRLPNGE